MTERELELRVERLEMRVEGLICSLQTLAESLAEAIGRDDVGPLVLGEQERRPEPPRILGAER